MMKPPETSKSFEAIDMRLDDAVVRFDGKSLVVSTGVICRTWRWTRHGLVTTSFCFESDRDLSLAASNEVAHDADWVLPVVEYANPEATVVSVVAQIDDDEGFTSKHIQFSAEISYPSVLLLVRFEVWAYPGAPGIRTQLFIKAMPGFTWDSGLHKREVSHAARRNARLNHGCQRNDHIPVSRTGKRILTFGYHSDTQNRNDTALDILTESSDSKPASRGFVSDWASAICVEDNEAGVMMVKESHKCVNQAGHDTGAFICPPMQGMESRGWGVLPSEIDGCWRPAWASWTILYRGGDHARQQAIKQFDRIRYPLRPDDLLIQSNTWGSEQGFLAQRDAASEQNVLSEIESCQKLGVDVLQIDDGWQGNSYDTWTPDPVRYPSGWKKVREWAEQKNVRLGLWLAAQAPTLADLQRNAREGNFVSFKLDFAKLDSRKSIDTLISKVREFILSQNHAVRVNWDLTEITPRFGYFFAREYGNIYLANRKPCIPRRTTYRPGTVLRDLWQVARYCNLLKFQGTMQNIDEVDRQYSDIAAYSHAYCLAITLMSSPLFFGEMRRFSADARQEMMPMIQAYKSVRAKLSQGIVNPIGHLPDGTQWTGFQCQLPQRDRGYLTLFREPWNTVKRKDICLTGLADLRVKFTNLLSGEQFSRTADAEGNIAIDIDNPASVLFLSYETEKTLIS